MVWLPFQGEFGAIRKDATRNKYKDRKYIAHIQLILDLLKIENLILKK